MLLRLFCGLLVALVALFAMPRTAPASEPTPYLSAQLGFVAGSSYPRGTTRRVTTFIRKCAQSVPGCPNPFLRSGLYFRLPPGISYVSHTASVPLVPVTCTVTAMPDGGEQLACAGGGLQSGMYDVGHMELRVAVANDAPLGETRIVMAVDDSLPEESGTLAECLDDILPNYCAELNPVIEVAPAADLYFDVVNHSPLVFQPDEMTSVIRVFVRNRGNTATAGTHMQAHLPVGFQWQLATTSTGSFGMTCSKSGTWQGAGETVTCSGGALAANSGIDITLGIRPRDNMEVPGPLPVVIALNNGASADPAVLLACASDSSPAHCAWHEVRTWISCARGRDSGIFCDGFDVQAAAGISLPGDVQTD